MIAVRMAVVSLLLSLLPLLPAVLAVEVNTEYGPVLGQTVPVFNGRETVDVNTWKGIPFGKSTDGERRFLVRIHNVECVRYKRCNFRN